MKVSIEPGKYFFYLRNREHYIGYNIEQSNLAGMTIYIKIHSVGTIHKVFSFIIKKILIISSYWAALSGLEYAITYH